MSVRVTYDVSLPAWKIEQSTFREIFDPQEQNGSTYTPPTIVRGWELLGIHVNFYRAMVELLETCCTEGANPQQIDSIDLGPLDPGSAFIATIVSGMESLTI